MSQYNENPGPDPKRPLMMQRLRLGHETPEIWNRLFPELKRYRGGCDEVWFSTGVGIPKLEEHRRMSALMAEHAKELREIGIVPSLQFQATLGHGDFSTAAAGAEGKTWDSYVGIHGEQCRYVNCPRQPGFLEYMREMAKIYAQWHPGSVWIDDDLRLQNHYPASAPGGCCCPYCLSLFSQEEGRTYTREEIEAAYETDCELKHRWDAFGLRSLRLVAETIAAAIHEVSPETRLALQHCGHAERLAIFDTLKKASGHRTGSRPGGGAYSDHTPYNFIDKGIACSRQQNSQQGYDTLGQICPEIESYPRVFTCKTAQGHRIESLFYLAMGMDSISYFMMDPLYETPEWYGRELLAPLAAEAPCYREFIRHNDGTLPGGIGLNCPAAQPILTVQELGLPLIGIPFGAYSPAAICHQITKKTAETLPVEQLAESLRGNVLLDGAAAAAIGRRGLGELLGGIVSRPIEQPPFDFYTDDPLNAGLTSDRHFTWQGSRFFFDLPENVPVRILSRYKNSRLEDFGPATVLLERPDGTRLAFIGNDGFNTQYLATARVLFLTRIADWTAHGKLPGLPAEPVQCVLTPRISPEGMLRSVTVLNATIGTQKPFDLQLRALPANAQVWWYLPASEPVKLEIKADGNERKVTLPSIGPWDIGWLKIMG